MALFDATGQSPRLRRSVLYVPASNTKAADKVRTLDCDAVILDLEDAVAITAKAAARVQAVTAVESRSFGHRSVIVRVNGLDTPWGADDVAAMEQARPDAVLIPKVSDGGSLREYRQKLHRAPQTQLWAMIETARGVLRLQEIAANAPETHLTTFVFGANDLAKELRVQLTPTRNGLLAAMSQSVMVARAQGLDILDAVFNDIQDEAGLLDQCRQGRELGFDGKTLIHPRQIGPANEIFGPSAVETEWARAVIAAFEQPANRDKGAIQVNGRMVERLHLDEAHRLLRLRRSIESRQSLSITPGKQATLQGGPLPESQ